MPPCTCCAYRFPHRAGSGACKAVAGQFTGPKRCEPGEGWPCPTCHELMMGDGLALCLDDGLTYGGREAWAAAA